MIWEKLIGHCEWQTKLNTKFSEAITNSINDTKTNKETLLRLIEGHDKLLQQLIPTINKQTQKIKKLEENYQMLVKVVEKIVTKIDPEWKTKTVKINTKKGK